MSPLPPGFESLRPFAETCAGETTEARAALRASLPAATRTAFFAACAPLLEPGLAYLDGKRLATFDDAQTRLLRLLLTFAHISLAEETQGDQEQNHAVLREAMRITRSPADEKPAEA